MSFGSIHTTCKCFVSLPNELAAFSDCAIFPSSPLLSLPSLTTLSFQTQVDPRLTLQHSFVLVEVIWLFAPLQQPVQYILFRSTSDQPGRTVSTIHRKFASFLPTSSFRRVILYQTHLLGRNHTKRNQNYDHTGCETSTLVHTEYHSPDPNTAQCSTFSQHFWT